MPLTWKTGPAVYVDENELAALLGVPVNRLIADRKAERGLPFELRNGRVAYSVTAVLKHFDHSPEGTAAVALVEPVFTDPSPPPADATTFSAARSLLASVVQDLQGLELVATLASLNLITRGMSLTDAVAATANKKAIYAVQVKRVLAAMAAMPDSAVP